MSDRPQNHADPKIARRDRVAYALLALVVFGILALLPQATWHSALSCDSRTHIEMMRAVADHGLPDYTNGPVSRFPELQARWNLRDGNRLWGTYPPLFAYSMAPFFRLGGLPAVSRANVVLLAVFAMLMFAVASRFFRDRLWGSVAAALIVFSTPIPATSIDMSPYILADVLFAGASYFTLVGTQITGRRALVAASFAGFLGALSVTAHLLTFPMVVGLLAAAGAGQPGESHPVISIPSNFPFRGWIPSPTSLFRAASFSGGLLIGFVPVATLNAIRFHSLNPISYGPCPWRSCAETGQDKQHIVDMAIYAAPALLWVAAVVATIWIARRRARLAAVAGTVLVAAFVLLPVLRIHAWHMGRVAWGNLFDVGMLDMDASPVITHPADGIGNMFGPWLIRSLLQCTPLLALAPFAAKVSGAGRGYARIFGLPAFLGLLALMLRANQPTAFAFGFPIVVLRYTTPMTAPLMILALHAIRSLHWSRGHGALAAIVGLAIGIVCWNDYDTTLTERAFFLYAPLLVAALTALAVWRALGRDASFWNRTAATLASACIALGIGINVGFTFPAVRAIRIGGDVRTDVVMRTLPPRVAIVGYGGDIDTALAELEDRDVEYADLYESTGWASIMELIDRWTAEGRPIFAFLAWNSDLKNQWPNVDFELVIPTENVFRIRKR